MKNASASAVKAVYDALPYPAPEAGDFSNDKWAWVNPAWIESLLPGPMPHAWSPERILIAGCGTGDEAFQMRNRFPAAAIVAVDYSAPAIERALLRSARIPQPEKIDFKVGDLADGSGDWAAEGPFDFISCHGVLSYIPDASGALRRLAASLTETGVLYLGVNGANHIGVGVRQSIRHFGKAPNTFDETEATRRLLELFDRMRPRQENIASKPAAYLASDILNHFSHDLPLVEWLKLTAPCGLHLQSTTELILNLSKTLAPETFPLLIPKRRSEICEIIAYNNEAPFHRLLLSKNPEPALPWENPEALLGCRFQATRLYAIDYPASTIDGAITLTGDLGYDHQIAFQWPVYEPVAQLIRHQDGAPRLAEALGSPEQDTTELIEKLFMLHQLGMIRIWEER